MRVSVVGLGYVGLVSAAGLTKWDHDVVGLEVDAGRLAALRDGEIPLFEPGLDALVDEGRSSGQLSFTDAVTTAIPQAQVVVVAVGTHDGSGGWQTETIRACLEAIVPEMADDAVLAIRSTLPPDFVPEVPHLVRALRVTADRSPIPVMTNPEFTREGSAVRDFLEPDRVVIGILDDPSGRGARTLRRLYRTVDAPVLVLPAADAAMAKLGANLFLATKISFANELAALCEVFGADVDDVVAAMAFDPRIGGSFLRAGIGFGGSCLPHQVSMTIRSAREADLPTPLLGAVDGVNRGQPVRFVDRLGRMLDGLADRRIALLGLTFKPGTDDLRDAPGLTIARDLLDAGAVVVAYDPMPRARERAKAIVGGLQVAETALDALTGADGVGLVTEWPEFAELDWVAIRSVMRGNVVLDGRNVLPPQLLLAHGYTYAGFGRRLPARTAVPAQARPEKARVPKRLQRSLENGMGVSIALQPSGR
jgi:UDPglucose 6-dehydrogenase